MKNLTIIQEDRPGVGAKVGEALGKAGINIEGACAFVIEGKAIGHILVDDAGAVRRALEKIGLEVHDEREVLVLEIEDQPGAYGDIARRIAGAGANIELVYAATNGRLVIAVDDLDKARAAV